MKYKDKVYGQVSLTEPVILELINSSPLQRLKGIDQAGYIKPYYPKAFHTRFDHSLGVYLLLKKYAAPLEEQIAGLIHDVSHSVFSHCVDYALAKGSEKEHNHQDNIFEEFVRRSEIPSILRRHQIDLDYVLNEKNFPLKEKVLPDLCADRIDYSFRTAIAFGEIGRKEVDYFLDNLIVKNKAWLFKDFTSAKKYADLFFLLNEKYFSSLASTVMFKTVGECVKYALLKKYLLEDDLYTTDAAVLAKIKRHLKSDHQLNLLFKRMSKKFKFLNDSQNYQLHAFCKSRAVDPLFQTIGGIKRISEVDSGWAKILRQTSKPKEYFIKFID